MKKTSVLDLIYFKLSKSKANFFKSIHTKMKTSFFYFHQLRFVSIFIIILPFVVGCNNKSDTTLSPQDALSAFEIELGFKIELLAAEPLISDPVDMEIDEYGRLYVIEMHGYPLDLGGSGKIKLLSDTDGDGVMDKSTLFAEGLILPNSIMRWKKGILVTDAPNVLYMEDRDGNGKAEVIDTLLTGFALSNPQHNLNNPLLGLDNWIYLAHEGAVKTETYKKELGDLGTEIYFPGKPDAPRLGINATGRMVRFQPDQNKLEITSSYTQFGHAFDAWGHHLLVSNANHIFQEVVAQTYLSRNHDLLVSNATQNLSDHGDAAEVFPITVNPQNQLLTDVGVITSACGLTTYLGGAFPAPFDDNVTFVAEPVSNLIHVDKLKEQGSTFIASRILEHKEFLASTDARFRPVNMYIGPDGALYVIDYYRQIIEHPEWMSDDVVKSGDLYNDSDKGRIYRITPTNSKSADWTKGLSLGDASVQQLVEHLANPNVWWRQNAQRLLVDRADKQSILSLLKMTGNTDSPMGRLHALWTLEGMGELKPEQIEKALGDPVSGIRENAIKLAELHLADAPQLTKSLLLLQADTDAKVRFQLLCTLGFVPTPEAAEARHKILFTDMQDNWVQIAALSASSSESESLLEVMLENFRNDVPAHASMVQRLASMIATKGNTAAIKTFIKSATRPVLENQSTWQAPMLDGIAQGIESIKMKNPVTEMEENLLVQTFFESPSTSIRKASLHLLKTIGISNNPKSNAAMGKAISLATNQDQSDIKRADGIEFIGLRNPAPYASILMQLFTPQEELSIQLAALRTLSLIPDTTVCQYLIKQWPVLTPDIQDAAVSTFMVNIKRVTMLLQAIESGKIQVASISWPRKVRMMAASDEAVRNRARALFTKNDEQEVNKKYKQALALKGDGAKGIKVFEQNCAICHQVRGKKGLAIGPDLGTVHNWSKEAIMANILAPNLSISSGYDLWSVELQNGESLQGMIASETPEAITLRNSGSADKTVSRKNIKSIKALSISLMTSGLENQINQQQMADLLDFLKQNK